MGRANRQGSEASELRASGKITTSGRVPGEDEQAEFPVFLGSSEEKKLNPTPLSEEDRARYRIEDIDPLTMLPYIEFDRVIDPEVPYHRDLMGSIEENGIQNQLLLIYNPHSGRAYIAEGNHRLGIARHLGIESIPVQVRVVEDTDSPKGVPVPIPVSVEDSRGRTLSLSDLGIVPGSSPATPQQSPQETGGFRVSGTDLEKMHAALEEGGEIEDLEIEGKDLSGQELIGGGFAELYGIRISQSNLSRVTLDGVNIQNASINYSDLSFSTLKNLDASGAVFGSQAKLLGAKMESVCLDSASFSGDISGLEINTTSMNRASFSYCQGRNTEFYGSGEDIDWSNGKWISRSEYERCVWRGDFPCARFDGSLISGASVSGSAFPGGSFQGVIAEDVDWSDCDLSGANLAGGKYARSNFDKADLSEAVWDEGDFTEASFRGARILGGDPSSAHSLRGACFDGASANQTTWSGSDLIGASFEEAHLEEASFDNVQAEGMSLRGAYAYGSTWSGVDMTGVDLRGACLAAADLRGARNLHLALLDGADFEDALLPEGFALPPGHKADERWTG